MKEKYKDAALPVPERVEDLLSRMTTEEKIAQANITRGVFFYEKASVSGGCSVEDGDVFLRGKFAETVGERGIGYVHDIYSSPEKHNEIQRYLVEETRLGIPCIFTSEALHGATNADCSILPVPLNIASTFDDELAELCANVTAAEVRAFGFQEVLAPNLDVAREQRWGRVEETYGEETYLSCRMARATIRGLQRGDIGRADSVIAEPKHYCVHGIPEGGLNCANARAGRREIETSYLPVFRAAIDEGAYNVMVCFNAIDGEPVLASEYYLKDVLKERLGLKGISRADWGAVRRLIDPHRLAADEKDAVRVSLAAGLDMQGACDVESVYYERCVAELLAEGKLDSAALDETVRRILSMKFELGLFEHPYTDETGCRAVMRCAVHKEIMLRAARESVVLLKNEGVLPLSGGIDSVAVIGPLSNAQSLGGYSGKAVSYKVSSVYDELCARLGKERVLQCDGCHVVEQQGGVHVVEGQPHLTQELKRSAETSMEEALRAAAACDAVILVCGDDTVTSGEGFDRSCLKLYGRQRELIRRAAALGKPTVLVLESGRAVDLSEEEGLVGAILSAGFGGEFGARAICETLFGENNPSGRLCISYPRSSEGTPVYLSMLPSAANRYLEGVRGALYPFGHGLSYTRFEYSDLVAEKRGKCSFSVSLTVKNCGPRAGCEVVQLYLRDRISSVVTPEKALRGYRRVELSPGQAERVEFLLGAEDFALLNKNYEWAVEPGIFDVMAGASSADIRLTAAIEIEADDINERSA